MSYFKQNFIEIVSLISINIKTNIHKMTMTINSKFVEHSLIGNKSLIHFEIDSHRIRNVV